MNTEQTLANTAQTDGDVILPAGDGFTECVTNTDDLQEVRARVGALNSALPITADGIARSGILLSHCVRDLEALVNQLQDNKPVTVEQLTEVCFDLRLATLNLSGILDGDKREPRLLPYRSMADLLQDAKAAAELMTMPLERAS